MAFAVTDIASATNTTTGTRTITVPAGGVPLGALIVINAANAGDAPVTDGSVADAGGNTYTFRQGASAGAVQSQGSLGTYTAPCTTALTSGQLITFTKPVSGTQTRVHGYYVTGHDSLDTAAGATNTGTATTTPSVTSGTPAVADSLFLAAIGMETVGASINQPGGAWTTNTTNITTRAIGDAYQVGSGTSAKTYNPTFNSPHDFMATMLVVSPPSSGVKKLSALGVG